MLKTLLFVRVYGEADVEDIVVSFDSTEKLLLKTLMFV